MKKYMEKPKKEKPSKELLLKALNEISEKCPKAVIGGSISFISRGILDREPNDIDVFLETHDSLTKVGFMNCDISGIGSDTTTDIHGEEIQRTAMVIHGVNVCVFKVKDEYLEYDEILYDGVLIKSQKPFYGIEAKKIYATKNDKHKEDLEKILKWQELQK